MNTSVVGTIRNAYYDSLSELTAVAGGAASVADRVRLDRVRADRDLILAPLEPASTPVFVGMPSRVGTVITVDAMALPEIGYDDGDGDVIDDEGDGTAVGDTTSGDDPAEVDPAAGQGVGAQGIAAITTSTVTKRELAFLDDKSLTIEEKIFRFLALVTKKSNQNVIAYLKEISGNGTKRSSGSSSTGTSGSGSADAGSPADGGAPAGGGSPVDSGGASGATTDPGVIPGLPPPYTGMTIAQLHEKFDTFQIINLIQRGDPNEYAGFFSAFDRVGPVVAEGVAWATHEFAGPALGAAVTAMGLPELAPIASSIGTEVGDLLGQGVKNLLAKDDRPTSTTKAAHAATVAAGASEPGGIVGDVPAVAKATSASTAASASASATVDEQLQMFTLQRLMDKQNAMVGALSNILKSLHDSRMGVIQNLR